MRFRSFASTLGFVVANLGAAGCGDAIVLQDSDVKVESVTFHPGVGTAGYGAISGYAVKLSDGSSDGATRTLSFQLSDIVDGTYDVGGDQAPGPHGATYVVKKANLTQLLGGATTSFRAVSGTVTLTASPAKVQVPGSSLGSWGSVQGHVDLVLVNVADGTQEIHVTGDYLAGVTSVG